MLITSSLVETCSEHMLMCRYFVQAGRATHRSGTYERRAANKLSSAESIYGK